MNICMHQGTGAERLCIPAYSEYRSRAHLEIFFIHCTVPGTVSYSEYIIDDICIRTAHGAYVQSPVRIIQRILYIYNTSLPSSDTNLPMTSEIESDGESTQKKSIPPNDDVVATSARVATRDKNIGLVCVRSQPALVLTGLVPPTFGAHYLYQGSTVLVPHT